MPVRLPPLNSLKAFEVTARHLSVKKAAVELNVTPAAVSHQIRTLEDYLGVQLFRRYNRALELTDVAKAALPKLGEGFACLEQSVAVLRSHPDGGSLTVSAAPSFASRWLMPRLHRFFAAQPDIDVRITARTRLLNSRGQDNAAERATVENWLEEADVAVIYGHGDYPGYRVDKLFALTLAPVCSPRLMQGENPLRAPRDLQLHALVHDDTGTLYDGVAFWDTWLRAAGVEDIDTSRGSHFGQPELALDAAAAALGVVATLPLLAAAELAAGRLILPFELQVPLQSAYYLVCPERNAQRSPVTAFRDWLLGEAAH